MDKPKKPRTGKPVELPPYNSAAGKALRDKLEGKKPS
jgi:hypothetical protein